MPAADDTKAGRQRRVDVRIKVNLKYPDRETFVDRFAQNLSRTGIFVRASDPAPVGSRIHFEYRLQDESRILRGVGIVRWARKADSATPDDPPGMGLEFIDLDAESDQLIHEIVADHGDGRRAPQRKKPSAPAPQPEATAAAPALSLDDASLDPEEEDALDALLGGAPEAAGEDAVDPLAALDQLNAEPALPPSPTTGAFGLAAVDEHVEAEVRPEELDAEVAQSEDELGAIDVNIETPARADEELNLGIDVAIEPETEVAPIEADDELDLGVDVALEPETEEAPTEADEEIGVDVAIGPGTEETPAEAQADDQLDLGVDVAIEPDAEEREAPAQAQADDQLNLGVDVPLEPEAREQEALIEADDDEELDLGVDVPLEPETEEPPAQADDEELDLGVDVPLEPETEEPPAQADDEELDLGVDVPLEMDTEEPPAQADDEELDLGVDVALEAEAEEEDAPVEVAADDDLDLRGVEGGEHLAGREAPPEADAADLVAGEEPGEAEAVDETPPLEAEAEDTEAVAAAAADAATEAPVATPAASDWILDLSGATLIASPRGSEGQLIEPKLAGIDGALAATANGTTVLDLFSWAGRPWPSAYALAAVRRQGIALSDTDEQVMVTVGDVAAPIWDAIDVLLDQSTATFAASPPKTVHVVIPASTSSAVRDMLQDRLAALGVANVRLIADAVALLDSVGARLEPGHWGLVVNVGMAETRVTLVRGVDEVVTTFTAPDLGLLETDRALADRCVTLFLREHELDPDDDPSLRDDLIAQIAALRRADSDSWTITIAGAPIQVDATTLDAWTLPWRERLAITCEALLSTHGGELAAPSAVIVAGDDTPWLGLQGTLTELLGAPVLVAEPGHTGRARGL